MRPFSTHRRVGIGMAVGAVHKAVDRPAVDKAPGGDAPVASLRHDGVKAVIIGIELLGQVAVIGHLVAARIGQFTQAIRYVAVSIPTVGNIRR